MPEPGYVKWPDYRVDLLRRRNRFEARAGDTVVASSERCIVVDEQDHGLVVYFPRDDVALDQLEATDTSSRCPFKGNASYWKLAGGEQDVAWSYDDPYPEVGIIAGYVAFYQDRVDVRIGVATPSVSGR
jgi:uncharacterized protein (DUF427 family)